MSTFNARPRLQPICNNLRNWRRTTCETPLITVHPALRNSAFCKRSSAPSLCWTVYAVAILRKGGDVSLPRMRCKRNGFQAEDMKTLWGFGAFYRKHKKTRHLCCQHVLIQRLSIHGIVFSCVNQALDTTYKVK